MNILNYLENKKTDLEMDINPTREIIIQLELVNEVLLLSQLNPCMGKTKFKVVTDSYDLQAELDLIQDNGGTILDIQLAAAAPSISVSAGDRSASQFETALVQVTAVIKYIENK